MPKLFTKFLQTVCLTACLTVCLATYSATLTGRVVKVSDGDTITVLDAVNVQHKIRLYGIDAPEKKQAFGQVSKKHLSSLVAGKAVRVEYSKKDKYGRILGTVFVGDTDINLKMIADGMAWHYKKFDKTPAYAKAEDAARSKRLGLWHDPKPIEPEAFRHNPSVERRGDR